MDKFSRDIDLEKRIDAYINGTLSEEEVNELWVDLIKNPEYIDLLETELGAREIIRRKRNARNVSEAPGSYRGWAAAAAAAVAVIIIVISLLRIDTTQTLQEMTLKNINIAENLASPDVLRGEEQSGKLSKADSLLNLGFKAALLGNPQQALSLYEQVTTTYKDATEAVSRAYLNIGIIRFNNEEYRASSEAFSRATRFVAEEDSVIEEKAYWYLGNCYIHLDELDKAREAVQKVFSMNGIYHQQAERLLDKLGNDPQ